LKTIEEDMCVMIATGIFTGSVKVLVWRPMRRVLVEIMFVFVGTRLHEFLQFCAGCFQESIYSFYDSVPFGKSSSSLYSSPDEEGEYDLDFIEGGVDAFLYFDFLDVVVDPPLLRSGLLRKRCSLFFVCEKVLEVSLILAYLPSL
jgi:hypothetical protein